MKKNRRPRKTRVVQELPKNNIEMERFINENRTELYKIVVDNIEYAMDNKEPSAEPFQFEGGSFVVLINQRSFGENLEHIFDYCLKNEQYELCAKIKTLMARIPIPRYTEQYKKINLL